MNGELTEMGKVSKAGRRGGRLTGCVCSPDLGIKKVANGYSRHGTPKEEVTVPGLTKLGKRGGNTSAWGENG